MKILQVKVTMDSMLGQLTEGNVYLVHDRRGWSDKMKNSGRLTLSQLRNAKLEEIIKRIKNGEEIIAVRITEED